MEPLFTTEFEYNYDEFKKFSWRLTGKPLMILVICYSLLVLVLGIATISPVYITLGVLLPVLVFLLYSRKTKRVYKSNRMFDRLQRVYKFYDTYFVIEDAVNNATVDYSLINKAVFTKTNVYLMIAKNQGYMLLKSNFPEGLEAFLRQITPKKK